LRFMTHDDAAKGSDKRQGLHPSTLLGMYRSTADRNSSRAVNSSARRRAIVSATRPASAAYTCAHAFLHATDRTVIPSTIASRCPFAVKPYGYPRHNANASICTSVRRMRRRKVQSVRCDGYTVLDTVRHCQTLSDTVRTGIIHQATIFLAALKSHLGY
jgi:hypothetical protein